MGTIKYRELNIGHLCKKICIRWRLVLASVLISVALFLLLGIVLSVKEMLDAMALRDALLAAGNAVEAEKMMIPGIVWFDKAFILVGVVIGLFFSFAFVGAPYILSPSIRCKEEVKDCLSIPLLGVIAKETVVESKSKIDKWLSSHLYPRPENTNEAVLQIAAMDIACSAKKSGIKSVHFASCITSGEVENIVDCVSAGLSEQEIQTSFDKSVLGNPESFRRLVEAQSVVLVEKVGQSCYDRVVEVLMYCSRYEIPVIGYILIEE